MYVVDNATVRALDASTVASGESGLALMDRAGAAATDALVARLRDDDGAVVVVCGKGNNGGDGLVVARRLHLAGREVVVGLVDPQLAGDALAQLERARACGVELVDLGDDPAAALRALLDAREGRWLVDAVLGTGFFFCGPGDVVLMFAIGVSLAIITGPLMPLFWSMIADTADYSEWKFGRRFTGLTFSAGTFSMKLGWALGPALAAYSLSYYGYQDNVLQSERTIDGLRLMMSLYPAALAGVAALVVLSYGINRKMELQMEDELLARKEAEGTVEG